MNGVENSQTDLTDTNPTDNKTLRSSQSPIALFVLKKDGNLAVVAIQSDAKQGNFVRSSLENFLICKLFSLNLIPCLTTRDTPGITQHTGEDILNRR